MGLDLERFVADCVAAAAESAPERTVREVVARAVSDPEGLSEALGRPRGAEVRRLHVSQALTVLGVVWAPRMTVVPHDHNMWAVVGIYDGREDNVFWRRHRDRPRGLIEAAGTKSLGPPEAQPLGPEIIHSVTNPTGRLTGAIHVYGGDFFAVSRSEWDPETLEERPYDLEKNMKQFGEAASGKS